MKNFDNRLVLLVVNLFLIAITSIANASDLKPAGSLTVNFSQAQKSAALSYGATASIGPAGISGNISHASFNSSKLNYLEGRVSYTHGVYDFSGGSGLFRFTLDYSNHYNSDVEVFAATASFVHSSILHPHWMLSIQGDIEDDLVSVPGQTHTRAAALVSLSYETARLQASVSVSGGHLDFDNGMIEDLTSISINLAAPISKGLIGRLSLSDQNLVDTFELGSFVQRAYTNQQTGRVSLDYGLSGDASLSAFIDYSKNKGNGFDIFRSQAGLTIVFNF
jgi:hypothetical protein